MICREETDEETVYIQYFVNGCKKQKNANDTYYHLETDRLNIGEKQLTKHWIIK